MSFYGCIKVKKEIFDKIPFEICISGSTSTKKYLLANPKETDFLESLGIGNVATMVTDYYKVELED